MFSESKRLVYVIHQIDAQGERGVSRARRDSSTEVGTICQHRARPQPSSRLPVEQTSARPPNRNAVRMWLRVLLILTAVYALWHWVDWKRVWAALSSMSPLAL